MNKRDYQLVEMKLSGQSISEFALRLCLDTIKDLIEEEPATPSCTHPESDIPFGNLVKDPDLMFTCLEYADNMRITETPDEVLAFAKRIYEWVK